MLVFVQANGGTDSQRDPETYGDLNIGKLFSECLDDLSNKKGHFLTINMSGKIWPKSFGKSFDW